MDPRKLSELIPFLKEYGVRPKRSLSQNFLVDANILRKIVAIAEVREGERVLEIGPGPGGLTKTLLEKGAVVFAIEKDHHFASLLTTTLPSGRLTVVEGDFLTYPFEPPPMTVIANIPYHISSEIITKLADLSHLFPRIYLTIQKELAHRICAGAGPENSAFALFVQYHFTPKIHFDISPSCFYPRPKVSSTLISLAPKPEKPFKDSRPFIAFIEKCFQQRRKMLRASVGTTGPFSESRPEDLTLADFLNLFAQEQTKDAEQ